MLLRVNEIFYSIQGEGARAGSPSIFIRLSGCDLSCGFCDTEFESGIEMSNEKLLDYISNMEYFHKANGSNKNPCKTIVWTGGEPALQVTDEVVAFFQHHGYYQCIETNGAHPIPKFMDFVSVSPKVAEHVLAKNFPDGVTELRYVRHKGQLSLPKPSIYSQHKFLSPMFNGDQIDKENLKHCINLIMEDPTWRLSVQLHKLLKVL